MPDTPTTQTAPDASYDIAVIGGGIHGAGVAQAAAAAGYRCVLIERDDWGAGTSSKSSKLIHGGLRYLENGQFRLVRESLQERRTLLNIAPKLVRPVPFLIPVYRETRRRPWQIQAGLWLYRLLAGSDPLGKFRRLRRAEWGQLSGLRGQGLQAVFQYWDAQTDDHALTAAVAHSAGTLGATLAPGQALTAVERSAGGFALRTEGADGERRWHCRCLVNAAGPWQAAVNQLLPEPLALPAIELVRGSHLILDTPARPEIVYVEAPGDGRAVFVMPWRDKTLIGTTECSHRGPPDQVAASDEEVAYLRACYRHYFPSPTATSPSSPSGADPQAGPAVLGSFAGLRVLPADGGERLFRRSRETLLITDDDTAPRAIAVVGGKLTGYRLTAERVIAQLAGQLPPRERRGDTARIPLHPAPTAET
ncbi:MAG TPA: glycerol-3-phosphate dehydrogenase/oxidase [Spongiibacteraceae bacterium]|jgi:glycerol-3-phosphate dehydrogenase|nr:glycerol-3-phosphate dehydrogenase/oxidase [Spongiibacteraceae bacterium]HUH38069.1 glycerol-3-phosphate dehydrogenase/oxidase [Spongiibacteraceae bacterium]